GQEAPAGATVAEATEFYGLKTRSTRIVFLLDRSGSMLAPGSEPSQRIFKLPPDAMGGPKEPPQETAAREEATRLKKRLESVPVATRWDALRKEFANTIYVLSPRVHFNVVWYEGRPDPWRQELVPATWVNKLDCLRHAEKLQPSGGTNIWDALEVAFQTIENPQRPDLLQIDRRVNYATALSGPDTFFLMTDGAPTFGRIITPEGILSELRKVNRLRKVTIHTICVGDLVPGAQPGENPDPAFLKRIADETGGDFVHIRR
ncbi:MAG: vWA domain-containing protein, partial [Planctomycetota bacterium]